MAQIRGVLETALYVDDVARSASFYERVLRFRRVFEEEDGRLVALSVGDAPQVLLLFRKSGTLEPVTTDGGMIPPHDGSGNLHVAFAVAAKDFDDWKRRLPDAGVEVESVVRAGWGGLSLYFRDPDGHLVELATPGIWPNY